MVRFRRLLLVGVALLFFSDSALAQVDQRRAKDLIKQGNAKYEKAEYQAAIDDYAKVSRSAGELYSRAIYNIGVCYYEMYRTEEAVEMYRLAIKLSEKGYPNASYALGVALEDLKQNAAAKVAYRQAIAASDDAHALSYFKLGVLTAEDDPHEAAALFRKAIVKAHNRFPNGHNNLGVMLARTGRFEEAKREFEIALNQAEGAMPEARHNLELCKTLLQSQAAAQIVGKLMLK